MKTKTSIYDTLDLRLQILNDIIEKALTLSFYAIYIIVPILTSGLVFIKGHYLYQSFGVSIYSGSFLCLGIFGIILSFVRIENVLRTEYQFLNYIQKGGGWITNKFGWIIEFMFPFLEYNMQEPFEERNPNKDLMANYLTKRSNDDFRYTDSPYSNPITPIALKQQEEKVSYAYLGHDDNGTVFLAEIETIEPSGEKKTFSRIEKVFFEEF